MYILICCVCWLWNRCTVIHIGNPFLINLILSNGCTSVRCKKTPFSSPSHFSTQRLSRSVDWFKLAVALIFFALAWILYIYCISWTNVHFSFFRQTENNVFEPLSIRVECWNLFWSVSTGQVTKGQVWFWIWTYKIIPDLWLLDLFKTIQKKCPHSILLLRIIFLELIRLYCTVHI